MDQKKDEKKTSDAGTLVGLRELLRKAAAGNQPAVMPDMPAPAEPKQPVAMPRMGFADGGPVPDPMQFISNGFMMPSGRADVPPPPQANPVPQPVDMSDIPPPAQPMGLDDVSTSLNKTPDTNYDFFKNLSADDRAALQQKLIERQNSAPSLIAQGAAGIGDAISNSYGGKNTTFQKDVMANNEAQQAKQVGALDTHRTQKMQDMNATMEMQQNDPKSPLSKSMQATFKSAGVNVPSGMPASMMMKIAPALGELAMKQATMEQQKQLTMAQQEIARQGQRNQATEALGKMGVVARALHGDEADQLKKAAGMSGGGHGIPDLGETFNGAKVTKVTRIK